jgi:hypothetical protein
MLNINRTKLVAGNWRDFETLLDVTKGRNGLKDPNSRPDHQTHQPRAAIKLKGLDFSLCPSAIGFQNSAIWRQFSAPPHFLLQGNNRRGNYTDESKPHTHGKEKGEKKPKKSISSFPHHVGKNE